MAVWISFEDAGKRAVVGDVVATDDGQQFVVAVLDEEAWCLQADSRFRVPQQIFFEINDPCLYEDFWHEAGAKIADMGDRIYVYLPSDEADRAAIRSVENVNAEVLRLAQDDDTAWWLRTLKRENLEATTRLFSTSQKRV